MGYESTNSWQELVQSCDQWIRSGQGPKAVALLNSLQLSSIPRAFLQPLCHLHYRVGLFHRALQALTPVIHPEDKSQPRPTERELATYAILLIKIGSVNEAKGLLTTLPSHIPEVNLYLAFAEQAVWDYDMAVPYLRRYLLHPELTPYERTVAEVNLVASLIATGETKESADLLNSLFHRVRQERWTLLYKNLQELLGQLAVAQGEYDEAKRLLKEAVSNPNYRSDTLFDFFIDKWTAIVELRQNPKDSHRVSRMHEIRAQAESLRHWESVRDSDRVLALCLEDEKLLHHVYFGTPFPAYRQKLVRESSAWAQAPETYIWGDDNGFVLDLATAMSSEKSELNLKPGQTLHRLLVTLASDRYRPLFIGHLFSNVFPVERYIYGFSDGRISAAVSRLRKWLDRNQVPLEIDVKDQLYRMKMKSEKSFPFGLRFTSEVQEREMEAHMASSLLRLQTQLDSPLFTSHEVVDKLKISKSSATRILRWGVNSGKLIKHGNNKSTKYGFAA